MAHEELMKQLPKGVERVAKPGPFFIKDNGYGVYRLVVLTEAIVTFGGIDSKERAAKVACSLNKVYDRKCREDDKLIN